ncbi:MULTISPECIES: MarR family winged helix-turn-helix transcriptional regulator [unclassified Streptomyces]|uniref:MarR family winged helix-turn-helix transcriptional regulator n=1 Tax=unclassified Streptomyces TaxID=2593676 RepID=UPI000D6814D9|nr:MarR family winged helix-turn-helix transcriptional regulator [Streptomyces sp. NWU339]PWI05644.1 MarR family transcriptional regulator [Streptomyces sp. NWU339]
MPRPIDELAYEHMLLTRYTLHNLTGRHTEGLERSAYVLLSRLLAQGPMSVGELSDAFELDVSTVHRQTAAAMRAGLVERIPDPGGGMARKFRVTELGEKQLHDHRAALREAFGALLEDWPDEDFDAFVTYLRRFNTAVEHRRGRPWPRP